MAVIAILCLNDVTMKFNCEIIVNSACKYVFFINSPLFCKLFTVLHAAEPWTSAIHSTIVKSIFKLISDTQKS